MKSILRNFKKLIIGFLPDIIYIYYSKFKSSRKIPNLHKPVRLIDKILWLKLNDRRDWHYICADKILSKNYIGRAIGKKYTIPNIVIFEDFQDFSKNIKKYQPPYIIKLNHDAGGGYIVRNIEDLELNKLKPSLLQRLNRNHYKLTKEYQYKFIKPKIFLEELLINEEGNVPNDYKLHVLNNKVCFTYCAISRETKNYRKIYLNNWVNEGMRWAPRGKHKINYDGPEIPKPINFDLMIKLAEKLSIGFSYLRVDFYEIREKVFVGELTQHPSSGNEIILPEKLDIKYGKRLKLFKSDQKIPY